MSYLARGPMNFMGIDSKAMGTGCRPFDVRDPGLVTEASA
jgi:hypothetical protein